MSMPSFNRIPSYPLPTSTPFTRQTAFSFIERLEDLYVIVREAYDLISTRDEAYKKLISDANTAITSALEIIKNAQDDVEANAAEVRATLAALSDALDRLTKAESSLDTASNNFNTKVAEFQGMVTAFGKRIDALEIESATHVAKDHIFIDVTDHGAKGDGVVDDTAAIRASISAAGDGGVVYFPRGEYRITDTLTMMRGQTLRSWTGGFVGGVGEGGSRLATIVSGVQNGPAVKVGLNGIVENLAFIGPKYTSGASVALQVVSTSGVTVRDVYIREFNEGIQLKSIWYTHFDHVFIQRCATAIRIWNCYNVSFYNLRIAGYLDETTDHPDGIGIVMEDRCMVNLHGGSIEGTAYGIHMPLGNGRQQLNMFGVYFETQNLGGMGVQIESRDNVVTAIGCSIYVTNYAAWINTYTNDGTAKVYARGNKFKGGTKGVVHKAYRWHTNGGLNSFDLSGDSWVDVVNDDEYIKYCSDTLPPSSQVVRPYGVAPVGGANMSEVVHTTRPVYTDSSYGVVTPALENLPQMSTHDRFTGTCVFDKTRKKPLWWSGTGWVDGAGTSI